MVIRIWNWFRNKTKKATHFLSWVLSNSYHTDLRVAAVAYVLDALV